MGLKNLFEKMEPAFLPGGKYSKLSKLPEDVITDGLKRLLSSTASYEFDSLLNLFEELTPKQLEEVLKSEFPVHAIAEYLN